MPGHGDEIVEDVEQKMWANLRTEKFEFIAKVFRLSLAEFSFGIDLVNDQPVNGADYKKEYDREQGKRECCFVSRQLMEPGGEDE